LNYPPTKSNLNNELMLKNRHFYHQNGNDHDHFTTNTPSPILNSIRTPVLAQNSSYIRDEISPIHYAGANAISSMTNGVGCRSSPKRSLLDVNSSMTSGVLDDDEQPLNLSKKQAIASPNSDQSVSVGRTTFNNNNNNIHSISGLSCR